MSTAADCQQDTAAGRKQAEQAEEAAGDLFDNDNRQQAEETA